MPCDICGSDAELLVAEIENTQLNVCKACASFGRVIKRAIPIVKKPVLAKKPELIEAIVPDYASIIKKKRESLGIKQEDFAKKINEKLSLIHHIETGKVEPSIELARKIEKFLHITLVEGQKDEKISIKHPATDGMTIGDLITIK